MKKSIGRYPIKINHNVTLLHRVGIFEISRKLFSNFLTVLNYHRIVDPYHEGFDTFRPNVSATPSDFAKQMDYVSQNYNVISGVELVSFIKGKGKLPKRAALITFDDGYYDNYSNAFPILKSRNLPAIIFLTTDFIGTGRPFYWDLIAYCFHHSHLKKVNLPCLGLKGWKDEATRAAVMQNWIAVLKKLPESEKQKFVGQLPEMMKVHVPNDAFRNIMMSWNHAREMSENGVEMGGHTVSHPILTRISIEEASQELTNCKRHIEEQIHQPALCFAYPNGKAGDYNTAIMKKIQQTGFEVAFTLLPGRMRYADVLKSPFAIRRVFLSYRDAFPRFLAKLAGVNRLIPKTADNL